MTTNNENLFAIFATRFPEDQRETVLRTLDGRTYSYMEAIDETARIARCLTELGLQRGSRVTVQVEKSPEAVWLYLACLRAGFIFHPLNTDYQRDELQYFIDDAEPAAIICDPARADFFREIINDRDCALLTLGAGGEGSLNDAAQETPPEFKTVARKTTDIAVLLYSSGTTGIPKGAMLTHGNLAANTTTLVQSWGFTENDVLLHALPIYHAHGLFVALGCVLMSGASMTFLQRFDADAVIRALPNCTTMMGVPTYYSRLLADERLDHDLCTDMRLFVSGSAPLSAEHFLSFEARTGHRILERYGMTETSMNAANLLDGERRPGSVGPALPGVSLRVVNDNDEELPAGDVGHLQVKGPNVFAGYWRKREQTARDFTTDDWFRTGDEARIEQDGYVSIVGRAKDMIISGGLNVYPREVEAQIDALSEIEESAVIGAPHSDFGEGVIAIVIATKGVNFSADKIIEQLRPHLAAYKLPKRVISVTTLPRNSMGKVQKNLLREEHATTFSD